MKVYGDHFWAMVKHLQITQEDYSWNAIPSFKNENNGTARFEKSKQLLEY
jgi:hypothetical protein